MFVIRGNRPALYLANLLPLRPPDLSRSAHLCRVLDAIIPAVVINDARSRTASGAELWLALPARRQGNRDDQRDAVKQITDPRGARDQLQSLNAGCQHEYREHRSPDIEPPRLKLRRAQEYRSETRQ